MGGVYVAVGKHDVVHSFVDGFFRLLAEGCQCFLQSLAPFCHFEEQGQMCIRDRLIMILLLFVKSTLYKSFSENSSCRAVFFV